MELLIKKMCSYNTLVYMGENDNTFRFSARFYFRESQFHQCFIYFDFFVICFQLESQSRNCYSNFSIFQVASFGYKFSVECLGDQRSRYNKKIYIFLSILSLLILLDILQNIFDMTIKTKHYIRTGCFTFLICLSSLKSTVLAFIQI